MVKTFVFLLSTLEIFSFGLLLPVLSVQLLTLGGNRFILGIVVSLQNLLQFIAGPIFGSWTDNVGAKRALFASACGLLVAQLILSVENLYCYILGRLVNACFGHSQILVKSLLVEARVEDQAGVLNKQRALQGLAFTIAPIIGGIIMEHENGFRKLSMLCVSLSVINIGVCHCLPSLEKSKKSVRNVSKISQIFSNLSSVEWKTFGHIFTHRFLIETAASIYHQNLGYVFSAVFRTSPTEVGFIISFYGVCGIIVNLTMKNIRRVIPKAYQTGSLGITISFIFIFFFPYFWTYIAFIVSFSIFKPLLDAIWTDSILLMTTDRNNGTVHGAFQSLVQLAGFIAPLTSGFLGQMYGQRSTSLLCIVLGFCACYVTTRIKHNK